MTTYTWSARTYYVLRNKTTSKRYMGQTVQDIDKYLGSGTYWKNHCNKHGGYTRENIEVVHSVYISVKQEAQAWLDKFESENPGYYTELNEEWCNLVPETVEKSPFRGNMATIFERHGNPFSGGSVQRKAHAEGRYDGMDRTAAGIKSWENRDRKAASETLKKTLSSWREENPEAFREQQRKKAQASAKVLRKKILYNGTTYDGWGDLKLKTGLSKYKFMKYNMGQVD